MKRIRVVKIFLISLFGVIILSPLISLIAVSCSNQSTQSINKPNDSNPANNLNSVGGSFNNLNTNKHLSTIKLLNLNNNTILSSLNDDALTTILKTTKGYENMEIKILDGSSTKNGILKLKLVGNYNNVDYDDEVVISGFYVNKKSEFKVSNLNINQKNYFDNHFPIKEKSSLPISNDLNVLKSIINSVDFEIDNKTISFDEMCKRYELQKIDLKLKNDDLNFKFIFNTEFKTYSNGNWIIDSQQEVLNQSPMTYNISILALNDLMKFMLDNFTLNEKNIQGFYPSYFKGLFEYSVRLKVDKTNLIDYLEFENILDQYKTTYFENKMIYPELKIDDKNSMDIDDTNGYLSFVVNLKNRDAESQFVSRQFTLNGLKTITSYLESQKNVDNLISIQDSESSSMAKNIKKMFNDNILDCFNQQKNQEIKLEPTELFNYLNNQWSMIFNVEEAHTTDKNQYHEKIDRIKNSYSLSLFNEKLLELGYLNNSHQIFPSFNLDTGLFKLQNNDQFYIEWAHFVFNKEKLNPILKMESNTNVISIQFNADIYYGLSNQEFSQNTKFTLTLTRNQFIDKLLDAEKQSINSQLSNVNINFLSSEKIDQNSVLEKLKQSLKINQLYDIDLSNFNYDQQQKIITANINIFIKDQSDKTTTLSNIQINFNQNNNSIIEEINSYIDSFKEFINDGAFEFESESDYENLKSNDDLKKFINNYINGDPSLNNPNLDWKILNFKDIPGSNQFKCNIRVYYKNDQNIYKDFECTIEYIVNKDTTNTDVPLDQIIQDIKLIPNNNPNYRDLTAKEFYKFKENKNEIERYFSLNLNELKQKYGEDVINSASISFTIKDNFDFNNPRTVKFEISVQGLINSSIDIRQKTQSFNDFKVDNNLIGELDAQPINLLKTPVNATSYKGKLEKFTFSDFSNTSENQYKTIIDNYTWDQVKLEFMYQVRFYLYQTFSDNYSEINYYIKDEVNEQSFTAIAEGIIKESKQNVFYGFLPHIGTNNDKYKWNNTENINSNDKIRIEIKFDINRFNSNIIKFRPSLIDRGDIFGDFTNSWWWNFKDNCNDLKNSKDLMYVDNLPRLNWPQATSLVSLSINGTKKIGGQSIGQWNSCSFINLRKIPK